MAVMSLEESLYELVGASLVACAAGLDIEVPAGAIRAGDAFVGYLSQRGQWGETNRIVEEMKREALVDRDQRGIVHETTTHHARSLAAVLEAYRPPADLLRTALEATNAARTGTTNGHGSYASRIAEDVLHRAGMAGVLQASGLEASVCQLLLTRSLGRLLADPAFVIGLHGTFRDYFASAFAPGKPGSIGITRTSTAAVAAAAAPSPAPAMAAEPPSPALRARLAAIKERHKLTDAAFERFLKLLSGQRVAARDLPLRLEEMALWLATLLDALRKPANDDHETRRLKAEAAAALAAGDFETAMRLLKQVRRQVREGRRRIEARLREEVMSLDAQMVEEAAATARLAEMELARRDYASAADLFGEAQDGLPRSDRQGIWLYAMRQGEALFRLGDEHGEDGALAEAVRVYGNAQKLTAKTDAPRNWAAAQCGIGLAHFRLGERNGDTGQLRQAVAAWRDAIEALGEQKDAAQRAVTAGRLAQALTLIGEREGGIAWTAQAADAYRMALEGLAREAAPAEWTQAQMGLGAALLALEDHEAKADGGARLGEAMAALSEALTVLSREDQPHDWALTQLNLGNALLTAGEREGRLARLGEAVLAFHEALQVFTREAAPAHWAAGQTSLANAFATLGERQNDPKRLEAAATAYGKALMAIDADQNPLQWAITQMNLGTVLVRLGEHGAPEQHWPRAMTVMSAALERFDRQGADAFAEIARRNLHNLRRATENRSRDRLPVS
jgi:tetratricopeptide (TPR) repeat protein